MDSLRGHYRVPYRDGDFRVGTASAVLDPAFVEESLRREERIDDGLNVVRGAVNALLISLVFWVALGVAVFAHF